MLLFYIPEFTKVAINLYKYNKRAEPISLDSVYKIVIYEYMLFGFKQTYVTNEEETVYLSYEKVKLN